MTPREPAGSPTLDQRVREQFPSVFITLVSVLVGLVFSELVSAASQRMQLWPLTLVTLREWGQLIATGGAAVSVWIIYSHIAISRRPLPTLGDSLVAFLPPLCLLGATTQIGRAELWPFLYAASLYFAVAIISVHWNIRLALTEPGTAPLRRIARPGGVLMIPYLGVPAFALMGWADQQHWLSPLLQFFCVAGPAPTVLLALHSFFKDWHQAIADAARSQETP